MEGGAVSLFLQVCDQDRAEWISVTTPFQFNFCEKNCGFGLVQN